MRHLTACGLFALSALACGCVSRELFIDSSPQGASAYVNGALVGSTPVSVPFRHYGDYTIEVIAEGRGPVRVCESIRAPWYCRFPLGFFSELILPVRIRDHRFLAYELPEHKMPDKTQLLGDAARRAE